jgi:hypothetical protein
VIPDGLETLWERLPSRESKFCTDNKFGQVQGNSRIRIRSYRDAASQPSHPIRIRPRVIPDGLEYLWERLPSRESKFCSDNNLGQVPASSRIRIRSYGTDLRISTTESVKFSATFSFLLPASRLPFRHPHLQQVHHWSSVCLAHYRPESE